MKAEAFIIHLDRAIGRRAQAEALAAKLPLPAHIFRAVDSEVLSDAERDNAFQRYLHRPRYPFELRREEIACFLSHRSVWQQIIDRDLDAAFIAEDDVEMDETIAPEVITTILKKMTPSDFVRLPVKAGRENGPEIFSSTLVSVIEPRLPGLGMQAQIVGREAARLLLSETVHFDRPVDTTIQLPGLTKARILAASPICFSHVDESVGGSVVQKQHKRFAEIAEREIKRFAYRLAIAAMVRVRSSSAS